MRDWLPEGHLALFVHDLVDQLDLSAVYESADDRGRRGYHPAMMISDDPSRSVVDKRQSP